MSTNIPMNCAGGTLILPGYSRAARTDIFQPSNNSATIIISWQSIKLRTISILSSSSLLQTEPIVAQSYQGTTGPPFKSASLRLSSLRSRSGTNESFHSYVVSRSTPRTVQLFSSLLDLLCLVPRPTRCILMMESESSATNREATPKTPILEIT